jgi:RNA polymerase sigma-70 factor (ECF subfamily)
VAFSANERAVAPTVDASNVASFMNFTRVPIRSPDGDGLQGYAAGLRRYFAKRAPASELDDLVQEVFLRIQSHTSDRSIDQLERYLFTVAASVLTDRARRRAVRQATAHEVYEERHDPIEERTPERVLLDREAVDLVIAAVADLPERTRDVFLLHRFEEMTCSSIAAQLGLSVSAVEKHIMKALRFLHARLSDDAHGR